MPRAAPSRPALAHAYQELLTLIADNRDRIMEDANTPVLPMLVKLRDAQFKRNYLHRVRGGQRKKSGAGDAVDDDMDDDDDDA